MKALKEVEQRLIGLGHHNRYWGRAEVNELPHILTDHEEILAVVTGYYQNGYALLVATDYRLLLIDKKPLFLNIEDTRYEMISEVDFSNHLLNAAVSIRTINKTMVFKSIRQRKLRNATTLIQTKVMELRQGQQQPMESAVMQYEPLPVQPAMMSTPMPTVQLGTQQQPDPANYTQPVQVQQASNTQPVADLGATALIQLDQQPTTGFRRFSPPISPLASPLTIRRRVSRFYPNTYPRY
ncbi:MAG TPA: PH domain-containing protein [Candidatus Saccharimonadales bacterium]|nr:PH domain-containing protein [Candidatus Saccharimonadales bacterium]